MMEKLWVKTNTEYLDLPNEYPEPWNTLKLLEQATSYSGLKCYFPQIQ